ncbi:trehalase [Halosquirtibacter xylanolyticus]|uniref:trehalase family glycosidase n=1 Tax=Halosquirtibacter xylanolyticus TaxID=3374599 RepID=UPI00374A27C7|nr:trehalase [Prolixibacteraceae bacterium]
MKYIKISTVILSFLLIACAGGKKNANDTAMMSNTMTYPNQQYGDLFEDVLSNDDLFGAGKLFNDSKDFLDAIPKYPLSQILEEYHSLDNKKDINVIKPFLLNHFTLADAYKESFHVAGNINEHIKALWGHLKRNPNAVNYGTLIPLNKSYIVPGGRFREIYYWDSYFTMLGLIVDNQIGLAKNMTDNFSDLIDRVGFIPNGNRKYYLSRSQPPFYSFMIESLAQATSDSTYLKYLPSLEKEYAFWMEGEGQLNANHRSEKHVIMMKDGEHLNRYYDRLNIPRFEMYRKDKKTAKRLAQEGLSLQSSIVYRDLRSAAESGWDFSSRWFRNGKDLHTIHTTEIVPVDLNSLLYHLELVLSRMYKLKNDVYHHQQYLNLAQKRAEAINKYCYDQEDGYYKDYYWIDNTRSPQISLAGVYPLFVGIASKDQAAKVADKVDKVFLKKGGVVTTPVFTNEQWDAPNGWAPLQWITYRAMKDYGHEDISNAIRDRWMSLCENVYVNTHKLLEKYNVVELTDTGGGEYPNQDGFGWTNGVYRAFYNEKYP